MQKCISVSEKGRSSMYRIFFQFNGATAHIDTGSYGFAVSAAYAEVYARMADRAWVVTASGESIYIAVRDKDDGIQESVLS